MARRAGDVEYRAQAVEMKLGRAGTGTQQVALRFQILDEGDGVPSHLTWYGSFTEAAFDITMKGLTSAGFEGEDVSDTSWLDHAPEVTLVVGPDTYNGKTTQKIKFINRGGGIAMKETLDEGGARDFADQMRGRIAAFRQLEGGPPPRRSEPTDNGSSDPEDIPF